MTKKDIGIYPWVENEEEKGDTHQILFKAELQKKGYHVKKLIYKKGFPISNAINQQIDVLILDWVHSFYTSPRFFFTVIKSILGIIDLATFDKKGIVIIWNMHNLSRHDGKYKVIERFCFKYLARKVNFIRVFDKSHVQKVAKYLNIGIEKIIFIPQGPYFFKERTKVNLNDRYRIPTSKRILLFFGNVRKGKGIMEFIKSFLEVKSEKWVLLIAGKSIEQDLSGGIKDHANSNENIIFDDRFIPDSEVECYFQQTDRLVLPYINTLNSGVLLLAKAFGTPVLANENFHELVSGNDMVGDLFDPRVLSQLLDLISFPTGKEAIFSNNTIYSWEEVISDFEKLFN
ncbi:MAG: glycosyltransferase [Saprospiraceae bacterium]|nr:glycosyltransferase [Saprospiraceae bacterium]MCB9322695.1 glycosyltransferase [Lewinellaceae bacterium]